MKIPADRKYTDDHEWAKEDADGVWTIGVTDFAQDQLGDITLVELPEVGDEISVGDTFGTVDSVKTFSDLYSPVSGTIVAINEDIVETPETLNEDPYEKGWLIKVKRDGEVAELLDAASYEKHVDTLA